MTAPEPDPVSELRKKLNELVDEATQDGLSRAQLAKKATVSAPVLSKALRDNYELSSWDGVGKFLVQACLQLTQPSDPAAAQLEWEHLWRAARAAQQNHTQVTQPQNSTEFTVRQQDNSGAAVNIDTIALRQPDPVTTGSAGRHGGSWARSGLPGRVRRASLKTKVSASVGVVVVVAAAITGGIGLTDRSNSAAAADTAAGAEQAPSRPLPIPAARSQTNPRTSASPSTYYLGNGACTEGSPDTRNSAVRLFPLKDVGNGSCTSLLRWTLRRQSTGGTYYYIIPDSFQGHYLTADPDAPAAVTARSQHRMGPTPTTRYRCNRATPPTPAKTGPSPRSSGKPTNRVDAVRAGVRRPAFPDTGR